MAAVGTDMWSMNYTEQPVQMKASEQSFFWKLCRDICCTMTIISHINVANVMVFMWDIFLCWSVSVL
jgi:hypothetical protein